jgi:uncharacterized protein
VSRVFLDANVLFSAAISDRGPSRAIFELADQYDGISLIVTEYVLEEALTNLQAKRPNGVSTLLALLDGIGFVHEPPEELLGVLEDRLSDPKDVPVLAGALYAGADVLVTADQKHFKTMYGERLGGCIVLPTPDALWLLLDEVAG